MADRYDVQEALTDGGACVVDALPPQSYRGERTNYARPGHIAGARNLPYSTFIEEPTAAFVTVGQARDAFERAAMLDRERVVLY